MTLYARRQGGILWAITPPAGPMRFLFWFVDPPWYTGLFRWLRARQRPGPEIAIEPRLFGRFRSDRRATVDYLETVRWCTPKALGRLAGILGTMTVRIEPGLITVETLGPPESRPYKVYARGENSVTIESVAVRVAGESPQPWRWTIDFADDGFWTCTQFWWLWWYREKFTRLEGAPSAEFTPAPS